MFLLLFLCHFISSFPFDSDARHRVWSQPSAKVRMIVKDWLLLLFLFLSFCVCAKTSTFYDSHQVNLCVLWSFFCCRSYERVITIYYIKANNVNPVDSVLHLPHSHILIHTDFGATIEAVVLFSFNLVRQTVEYEQTK